MKSPAGFSLIELLVVISILSILSIVGFVNFKNFSSSEITSKAVGQIQTFLRLSQSNATSYTTCNGSVTSSWYLSFPSGGTTVELRCNPGGVLQKTETLVDARVAIAGNYNSGCDIRLPASFNYSPGVGAQTISSPTSNSSCLQESTVITFTVSNTRDASDPAKVLKISKGGAINVQ